MESVGVTKTMFDHEYERAQRRLTHARSESQYWDHVRTEALDQINNIKRQIAEMAGHKPRDER